jgi:flavin reductase (DIM6/NTAB) family NADH-FMN oxidoreductase RutF
MEAVRGAVTGGVVVVATAVGGRPFAMVADCVLEMDDGPGTLLVFVDPASPSHDWICRARFLGLTVMSLRSLISIAGPPEVRMTGASWSDGPYGVPLLDGAESTLALEVCGRLTANARTILCGSVLWDDQGYLAR